MVNINFDFVFIFFSNYVKNKDMENIYMRISMRIDYDWYLNLLLKIII